MNTAKDLLLHTLTAKGFIYYPEMKRLMLKSETANNSMVTVIEMNEENQCRFYFCQTDLKTFMTEKEDTTFSYDASLILNHLINISESTFPAIKIAA